MSNTARNNWLIFGLITAILASCSSDDSTSSQQNTSTEPLVGKWHRFNRSDSHFDSANYFLNSNKMFEGSNYLQIKVGFIQEQRAYGSWNANADSITLVIDSILQSFDGWSTHELQSSERTTTVMGYRISNDTLFMTNNEAHLEFTKLK